MSEFGKLSEICRNWPDSLVPSESFAEKTGDRLRVALHQQQIGRTPIGSSDIVALIRHWLRTHDAYSGDRESARRIVEVPKAGIWPDLSEWKTGSVEVLGETDAGYQIRAMAWLPKWLENTIKNEPFESVYSGRLVRSSRPCAIDPFVGAATGFGSYKCLGQREAVRRVAISPIGSTTIVTLPTGVGKSLLAWLPALTAAEGFGTVLVVVPTVSLALDQQKQFRELIKQNETSVGYRAFAWHSGLQESDKLQIKKRLRNGTQRILFCSPESLQGALIRPLYDANKSGRISHLVVDEAHLVSAWGEDFRPMFQSLVGLRRDLLSKSPVGKKFKTILLTATLTESVLRAIKTLYTPNSEIDMLAAVSLRQEPTYWMQYFSDERVRQSKVMEVIAHAPRPVILYCTRPQHAKEWLSRLRNAGYTRVGCFHGDTVPSEKERILAEWNNDAIDVMVATSAFGVGVDKQDVRTVIHACVPESLDRFYQEVGRGGRDGKSSTSILLHTDNDRKLAAWDGQ